MVDDIRKEKVIEKFLRYIAVDTTSSETSGQSPSTQKQKVLGRMLKEELSELGAEGIFYDEVYNYLYAFIPSNDGGENKKTLGFISHMDTSPEASGENIRPQFVYDYDGGDISLGEGLVLSPERFPELLKYKGKTLITTDGTTLLGADDKAGIAEIMTMAEILLTDIRSGENKYRHGRIAIAFTPDEEIDEGTKHFDVKQFGADYAYTVDGGELGELEYENFNAAAAVIKVHGLNVHPGEAKNKMLNAIRVAAEFDSLLPERERPEYTEGYEGFCHLMKIGGNVEEAVLEYIIRDHDREKFEAKKENMKRIAALLNEKYKPFLDEAVSLSIRDQYFNMREKIEPDNLFLIENARKAMTELDITPKISPIRGGTDGANLSFTGVPCPNLCAGGHNFHGKYEYVCVESMIKIYELLLKLSCLKPEL